MIETGSGDDATIGVGSIVVVVDVAIVVDVTEVRRRVRRGVRLQYEQNTASIQRKP